MAGREGQGGVWSTLGTSWDPCSCHGDAWGFMRFVEISWDLVGCSGILQVFLDVSWLRANGISLVHHGISPTTMDIGLSQNVFLVQ